jgi:hypothetical protein
LWRPWTARPLLDRFEVGDLRLPEDRLDAELLPHLAIATSDVNLAVAADQKLVRARVAGDPKDRILFHQPGQGGRDLVLVTLGLRLDRERDRRLGEGDREVLHRMRRIGEGLGRPGFLQLRDAAEIAGA